jgi:type I restriction enzyme R subunit
MTNPLGTERTFEEAIEAELVGGPAGPARPGGFAEEQEPFDAGGGAPAHALNAPSEGGYRRRDPENFDADRALDPETLFSFIMITQPKTWSHLRTQYGDQEVKGRVLARIDREIGRRGVLDVLRNGVKDVGARIHLAYFKPAHGLNEETARLYRANVFQVMRQVRFNPETAQSVDLVLLLNGVPLFTAELKSPMNGQSVEEAIWQYKKDRSNKHTLFHHGRCLAHFAVDPEYVFMTTKLEGKKTTFLPFNRGNHGGAGNPPVRTDYATAYLWRDVWRPDSVLELVEKFCADVYEEDPNDGSRKRKVIFPRYHQREAVQAMITDIVGRGAGKNYLVQHSAGSGKSNTIAWLAHQLSMLFDQQDARVFDSIIVITDRRVLDRQLRETIKQFENVDGVVAPVEKNAQELRDALEKGRTIITTTLQKFPMIVDEVGKLPGKRFAVIVDEAHSSQGGDSAKQMKSVLGTGNLDDAERQEEALDDPDDRINAYMEQRGPQENISLFAFTATPKPKTLELFGERQADGSFEAFHTYSMRQAIEERFIHDVLENYTTYQTYWSLLKMVEDDPAYNRKKAAYLLRQFAELSHHAIQEKTAIIVTHLADHVVDQVGGQGRAMLVTRSRLHAVRYKQAVDAFVAEHGYPFRALVAFSGDVNDDGATFTEAGMNGFPEGQTAQAFRRDEYRLLIVANKFQTGFDEPLLHTMYVDRKLAGVQAVQTLSRLNRTHPAKDSTAVLDFANEADEIQVAFEPFYETTILSEGTDPNVLYDREHDLRGYEFHAGDDIETVARIVFSDLSPERKQAEILGAVRPVVESFDAAEAGVQKEFRSKASSFIRLYSFLSQILTFRDPDLEKAYWFFRALVPLLRPAGERLPTEVQDAVDLESYRVQRVRSGRIRLEGDDEGLKPAGDAGKRGGGAQDNQDPLSAIIEDLNRKFGFKFGDSERETVRSVMERMRQDQEVRTSVQVNNREVAEMAFGQKLDDHLLELVESNYRFFKEMNDDDRAKQFLKWRLFDWYRQQENV